MTVLPKAGLSLCVAALLGIGAAAAHDHGPRADPARLEAVDLDGDGQVSRDEAIAARDEAFAKADGDGDGAVTQAEMSAFHAAHREARRARMADRMFARADTDGDGVLSIDEFGARSLERFDQADTDGNGMLSEAEREAAKAAMRERAGKMRQRGGQ